MPGSKGEGFPRSERPPEDPPKNGEHKEGGVGRVPESEITLDFVRSSGPGGQKVNKTSSKAQLRWSVGESPHFTEDEKRRIREVAGHRLNADDEIVLAADTERSQQQNRNAVIDRLDALIEQALAPKKERRATRVSRSQKRKRLDDKRRTGEKKRLRKPPKGDW